MSVLKSPATLQDLPAPPPGKTGWPWTEASQPLPPTMPDGQPWPQISIVTPSYNQGEFIEETIRSVLLQGYPNLEYIIMDGGSTDETQAILERYTPWLSHVVSEPDNGQSDAIATGFEIAEGEIFAWLCSDDLYLESALEWVARQYTANPEIALFCGATRIDQGTGWFPWMEVRYEYTTPTYEKLIACNQCVQQPACFWTKKAYRNTAGIDRSLQFCMDYDLLLKLCQVGKAKYVNCEIAWMRLHEKAKTHNLQHIQKQEKRLLVENALKTCSSSNLYLCTLSYLRVLTRFNKSPRHNIKLKVWQTIRLFLGYLYHLLNGDMFRWHPIHGFRKVIN